MENAVFHLNNNLREMARQTGSCYLDNFDTLAATEEAIFSQDGIQLTLKHTIDGPDPSSNMLPFSWKMIKD